LKWRWSDSQHVGFVLQGLGDARNEFALGSERCDTSGHEAPRLTIALEHEKESLASSAESLCAVERNGL
jgi:hypothetical protein